MRPTVHSFESTAEAYDFVQCYDTIKVGDLLHIPSEGVVGVAETWPFAVTLVHGALHSLICDPEAGLGVGLPPSLMDSYRHARQLAVELGYELAFPST